MVEVIIGKNYLPELKILGHQKIQTTLDIYTSVCKEYHQEQTQTATGD